MRKPLTNKQRFEIFKRDGFTCQYCGASSQEAKLVVDHIEPHSKGGKCEDGNFITACFKCNSGKAANPVLPCINEDEHYKALKLAVHQMFIENLCFVCGTSPDYMSYDEMFVTLPAREDIKVGTYFNTISVCVTCLDSFKREAFETQLSMCSYREEQSDQHVSRLERRLKELEPDEPLPNGQGDIR